MDPVVSSNDRDRASIKPKLVGAPISGKVKEPNGVSLRVLRLPIIMNLGAVTIGLKLYVRHDNPNVRVSNRSGILARVLRSIGVLVNDQVH